MRARTRPDDRVAEAAQRRLEALVAELGGHPTPTREQLSGRASPPEGAPPSSGVVEEARAEDDELLGRYGGLDGGPDADGHALGRHARRPLSTGRRAASWAGDRLPTAATRLRIGARHVAVVGLLLIAGLLLAGWSYLQATRGADPNGQVVAPRATGGVEVLAPTPSSGEPSSSTQEAEADSATAGATAGAEVVVDVEGKVRRPGIAVLPAGSRVVDALEAAGGARAGADVSTLNLARVLVDGEQLLVGVEPPAGVAAGSLTGPSRAAGTGSTSGTTSGAAPVALVNLNTADQTALETLPGVGPVTAVSILEWRTQHGAFTSVDELLEVSGIGEATLAEIAPHVTL